jgi:hypothetical protein
MQTCGLLDIKRLTQLTIESNAVILLIRFTGIV